MAAYATAQDVQARMTRPMTSDELSVCSNRLEDAAVMIDAVAPNATPDAKFVVSCRMLLRVMSGESDYTMPVGATQGSISALGYQQSFTFGASGAGSGELYIGKADMKLLGANNKIGSFSPVQGLAAGGDVL